MSYPIYHGIKVAGSAQIHNLNVETLTDVAIAALTGNDLIKGRLVYDEVNDIYNYVKADGTIEGLPAKSLFDALQSLVETINGDATTAGSFRKAIQDVIGTAPAALDTLQEIANSLNNDPDLYNTLTTMVNTNITAAKNELRGTVSTALDTFEEVETTINTMQNDIASLNASIGGASGSLSSTNAELDATQLGAGLNADGTYTANTTANFINAASSLKDADDTLDTSLQTEKDRALAAESALDGRISTVEGQVNGNIGDLTTLATADQTNLVASINEVHGDVDTEAARAQAAEGTLDTKINATTATANQNQTDLAATISSVGLGTGGAFSAFTGSTIGSSASYKQALEALDVAVAGAASGGSGAQAELDATQLGAGLEADGSFSWGGTVTNYAASATNLKSAIIGVDTATKSANDKADNLISQNLDTRIGDLSLLNTDAKTSAKDAINEVDVQQANLANKLGFVEVAAMGGADWQYDMSATNYLTSAATVKDSVTTLDTKMKELDDAHKARFFTFKSTAPALTHTINHGLNTEFVNVQLWVKSPDDGLYRMDIAEVKEVDLDNIEVIMNATRDVKVVIEKRYA